MEDKPNALIFSGAAASGKSSLIDQCFNSFPDLHNDLERVVTDTSRDKRDNEIDGMHYHFRDYGLMKSAIAAGEYFESASIHSTKGREYLYGSRKQVVTDIRGRGKTPLFVIDIQGAATLRSQLNARAIAVYPSEPWRQTLIERMRRRGDTPQQIEERIASAEIEMNVLREYDFQLVNEEGRLVASSGTLYRMLKEALASFNRKP